MEFIEQKSEMMQKIDSLMAEIKDKYNIFNNIYCNYYAENISGTQMVEQIREILMTFNKLELKEYNQMWKMFSETNCGFNYYQVAQIVHKEIMNILYPD